MTRSVFSRLILLTCGILTIAGAAGAMRVKHWTPIDAFLEHRNTTPVIGSTMGGDLRPSSTMALNHRGFGAFDPDALAPGGFVTGTAGKLDMGKRSDAGWADDRLPGAPSAGTTGGSASLGGLWRLMGLAHGQDHAAATSTTHSTVTHTAATAKPTTHSSTSHTTAPTVSTTVADPVATIAQVTTPAILIGNNTTPVSGLINGSTTLTGGSITPGHTKTGIGAGTGVSGFSATPEPTSALLFGTGLLLLSMTLRRRRT